MKITKTFTIKFVIYSLVCSYILLDLFLINGPIKNSIDSRNIKNSNSIITEMEQKNIAAFVYMKPIYLSQVDYKVAEHAKLSGLQLKKLNDKQLTLLRNNMLDQLIINAILRTKTDANQKRLNIIDESINHILNQLQKRIPETQKADTVYAYTGIEGEKEMRLRVQSTLELEAYIESFLTGKIKIEEEQLKKFYEKNKQEFNLPYFAKVRHIFIARLDNPNNGAQLANQILQKLNNGVSFQILAKQYSNDSKTATSGGELGLISQHRSPKHLHQYLFHSQLAKLPVKIIEGDIGWNIIEKTGHIPAKGRQYKEVREEIKLALIQHTKSTIKTKVKKDILLSAITRYRHIDNTKDYSSHQEGHTAIVQRAPDIITKRPFSYIIK